MTKCSIVLQAYEVYQQAQAKWPDNKDLVLKLRSLSKLVKLTEKKEEVRSLYPVNA